MLTVFVVSGYFFRRRNAVVRSLCSFQCLLLSFQILELVASGHHMHSSCSQPLIKIIHHAQNELVYPINQSSQNKPPVGEDNVFCK